MKELLKEAKQETKRGRRAQVKEEDIEEEKEIKQEPKRRGGRVSFKQEVPASPEPVITVGRGKRKKVCNSVLGLKTSKPNTF